MPSLRLARGKGEEYEEYLTLGWPRFDGPTRESRPVPKAAGAAHFQGLRSFLQQTEKCQRLWGDVATCASAYLVEQFYFLQGALQDGVQGH